MDLPARVSCQRRAMLAVQRIEPVSHVPSSDEALMPLS